MLDAPAPDQARGALVEQTIQERKTPRRIGGLMEREKGFEPSTLALARRCSTAELFPQNPVSRGGFIGSRPPGCQGPSRPPGDRPGTPPGPPTSAAYSALKKSRMY